MIFSHEVPLQLPTHAIHLDEWLFNLSESEYQACARGHRAVGTNGAQTFSAWSTLNSWQERSLSSIT